jgi:hypothetical protein
VLIDLGHLNLGDYADSAALVSAVSMAELAFGLDVPDPVERLARTERYDAIIREFDVAPFDLAATKIYGTLAALVRGAGRNPRPRRLDLQIAATSAAQRIPLLTRKPDDFLSLDRLISVIEI